MFTYYVLVSFLSIQFVNSMSVQKPSYLFHKIDPENQITDFIYSKGYLPNENILPEPTVMKSTDGDVTYLLSKLSDSELINLLNDQPKKKSYDLDDIIKIGLGGKSDIDQKFSVLGRDIQDEVNAANRFHITPRDENNQQAYYKLNRKPILANEQNNEVNFLALKKLQNLLMSRPEQDAEELTEERKELLFDILVAQLKTLCCKSDKSSRLNNLQIANNNMLSNFPKGRSYLTEMKTSKIQKANEFMFLIINDEIRSKNTDELIFVDPESLEKNSSVLLLGPITAPLTDSQLKIVMNRIANELSKPEYTSLLQQLSDGTLSDNNMMKNFIFGAETRRYIKPHRCNYQSKLAKIYGGPRWLICTGYLNLNTPSLYD